LHRRQATAANQRTAEVLGTPDPSKTPVTRATTTWSRHPEMAGQDRDAPAVDLNLSDQAKYPPLGAATVVFATVSSGAQNQLICNGYGTSGLTGR
jgi:hypothetical protein